MFDGLKKKLNRFRQDVEETAEEKAEEAAEEEAEAEAEPVEAETADADAEEAAAADTSTAEEAVEEPQESEVVSEDGDADAEAEPVAETADAEPAEPATDSEPVDDTDSEYVYEGERPESLASDAAKQALAAEEKEDSSSSSRLKRAAAFATGKVVIEEEDLEDPLWELEMALLQSDVEMQVAGEILETIREKLIGETRKQVQSTGQLVEEALHDALYEVISVGQFDFDQRIAEADKPVTLIFTGINGVGKTTSIAKLAKYFEKQGYSTVLANGDTYRAGANEQIREHAEALDKKLIAHEQGGDPAAVIYDAVEYADAHDIDIVLGDTAGRLHTSNDLMAQLEKIDRVVGPDLTIFVDEAVAGQDAVERARKFNEAASIDGAILTKADADSNGGAAISIAYVTGKPILFLGVGQGYDHIERFDPEAMVERLLGDDE
ncbi:signal recognition particle-docking protein FtsY [Haloferax sp. DFSO60]|uniref:signal recognition particle-docking protein FtsY n=1 Tax=Haloferax sp. DFSO60 TaxID=3388652 RepID=UPI00397A9DAF